MSLCIALKIFRVPMRITNFLHSLAAGKIKSRKLLLLLLVIVLVVVLNKYFDIAINITPSMKYGIYIKANGEIGEGDTVSVCLKDPYKKIALERNYAAKGSKCSGIDPLIKEVVAIPGDDVILADKYVEVNQKRYSFPTSHFDSLDRVLAVYPRGKYLHTPSYWLIGVNNKKSWDSRYFGPVSRAQILTKLKPLWVW